MLSSAIAIALSLAAMSAQPFPRHLPVRSHLPAVRNAATRHLPSHRFRASALPSIDTVPSFTGSFQAYGYNADLQPQTQWSYTMLGAGPGGGTTTIPVKIVAVTVEFVQDNGELVHLSFDSNLAPVISTNGTPLRFEMSDADLAKVMASPLFNPYPWPQASGTLAPTQYGDAFMHAQFPAAPGSSGDDWHTLLVPQLVTRRTIRLPLTCIADGNCIFAASPDYKRVVGMGISRALFEQFFAPEGGATVDASTILGAAIVGGDVTTQDIAAFLLSNLVVIDGDAVDGNEALSLGGQFGLPAPGDATNGNRQRLYIGAQASYLSQEFANAVGEGFYFEIAALSQQLATTFADPFYENTTPWWTSYPFQVPVPGFPIPNPLTGPCGNELNVAGITAPNPQAQYYGQSYWSPFYPVHLNSNNYYVANLALLSWFGAPSPQGVYSFPDMQELYAASPIDMQPLVLNGELICIQVAPGASPPIPSH